MDTTTTYTTGHPLLDAAGGGIGPGTRELRVAATGHGRTTSAIGTAVALTAHGRVGYIATDDDPRLLVSRYGIGHNDSLVLSAPPHGQVASSIDHMVGHLVHRAETTGERAVAIIVDTFDMIDLTEQGRVLAGLRKATEQGIAVIFCGGVTRVGAPRLPVGLMSVDRLVEIRRDPAADGRRRGETGTFTVTSADPGALLLGGEHSVADDGTITDSLGRTITVTEVPMRFEAGPPPRWTSL